MPSAPSAKGVIFDLDGVLVDSEALHVDAWRELFARHQFSATSEEYARGVGMSDADWLAWLAERRGLAADLGAWCRKKREIFQRILAENVRPFPGVVPLVRSLRPRCRLAVASNSPRESILTALGALGICDCFDALVGADDVARHKPHPEAYQRAAERLGLPPAACLVIEDSPLGIEAAKAAGMACIGITNSLAAEQLRNADVIVASLEDAQPILDFLACGQPRAGLQPAGGYGAQGAHTFTRDE